MSTFKKLVDGELPEKEKGTKYEDGKTYKFMLLSLDIEKDANLIEMLNEYSMNEGRIISQEMDMETKVINKIGNPILYIP